MTSPSPSPPLFFSPQLLESVNLCLERVLLSVTVDCNRRAGNLVAEGPLLKRARIPLYRILLPVYCLAQRYDWLCNSES